MANTGGEKDPLTRGLGMAIAAGALAAGAVAAFLNNERTRQMRADLQRQIDDLTVRLDHELTARRPEIENAIQRGRHAAVEGLERMKGVVEQGAEKAQDYVQKASVRASDSAVNLRNSEPLALDGGATPAEDSVNSVIARAEETMNKDTNSGEGSLADVTDAGQALNTAGNSDTTVNDSAGGTIGTATTQGMSDFEATYNTAEDVSLGEGATPGASEYEATYNTAEDVSLGEGTATTPDTSDYEAAYNMPGDASPGEGTADYEAAYNMPEDASPGEGTADYNVDSNTNVTDLPRNEPGGNSR